MPSFSSFIAKKYFFSLGKLGAIRLMSLAALVGLALGTAAMTVVLSAFAGLEDLILTQFEDANATLKIESATGPFVELTSEDSLFLSGLEANFEETSTMAIYEKRVLLTYGENQHIAYLLGVPKEYAERHHLSEHLLTMADPGMDYGTYTLTLGAGVAYHLGLSSTNPPPIVSVYLPKITSKTSVLNLSDAIDGQNAFATAIHSVQPDYDQKYALAPQGWFKDFTGAKAPSFIEIHTAEERRVRKAIEAHFGNRMTVANRLEQEATLFKVMRSERMVVVFILAFIVLLASFGVVSALIIIALEKKDDVHTLWAMGASEADLRSIFFKNGLLIVATGWLSGMVVGLGIIALQHYVGIVPLGTGYVQEYYPVSLKWEHIALTSAIVLGIGSSLSAWATRRVIK
ncbi:MAG: ABC transporter permease [Schleiferiaceae bacterium]